MIESALEWQLKLLEWQFFVTLTWDSVEDTTPSQRRMHASKWIKWWAAKYAHMRAEMVAEVIRWERGEVGDRPHCHLLITGLPKTVVHLTTCFRLMAAWKYGISQVRLYDPSRNGEAYMTKGKFSYAWAQGANAYELKKFNSLELDALYISPRAMQLMMEKRVPAGDESYQLAIG